MTVLDLPLCDPFCQPRPAAPLAWLAPPARWSVDPAARVLRVEPDAPTDFWQRTHYGFQADNGHFLHAPVAGDFVLSAHVRYWPAHQYDQAGVMIRCSASCWVKASIEAEPDGPARLGAVVTNLGYSDWSTQDVPPGPGAVWLRVRRVGDDVHVDHAADGRDWRQLRVAHLHEAAGGPVLAGLYACSPRGAGFVAEFSHWSIEPGGPA